MAIGYYYCRMWLLSSVCHYQIEISKGITSEELVQPYAYLHTPTLTSSTTILLPPDLKVVHAYSYLHTKHAPTFLRALLLSPYTSYISLRAPCVPPYATSL
eukprot:1068838-Rhodomonas_salina.2